MTIRTRDTNATREDDWISSPKRCRIQFEISLQQIVTIQKFTPRLQASLETLESKLNENEDYQDPTTAYDSDNLDTKMIRPNVVEMDTSTVDSCQ